MLFLQFFLCILILMQLCLINYEVPDSRAIFWIFKTWLICVILFEIKPVDCFILESLGSLGLQLVFLGSHSINCGFSFFSFICHLQFSDATSCFLIAFALLEVCEWLVWINPVFIWPELHAPVTNCICTCTMMTFLLKATIEGQITTYGSPHKGRCGIFYPTIQKAWLT